MTSKEIREQIEDIEQIDKWLSSSSREVVVNFFNNFSIQLIDNADIRENGKNE